MCSSNGYGIALGIEIDVNVEPRIAVGVTSRLNLHISNRGVRSFSLSDRTSANCVSCLANITS